MGFSVFVEGLNLRRRRKRHVVDLNPTFVKESPTEVEPGPAH
jgi:hypothetical protein